MRLAIMQPYLFPYLGYYQLVSAVDKFIFFDDVNYINKGWINRNQILQQNEAYRFTLPLIKASQNRLINEIEIADFVKWRKDFLKQIEFNYKKAPCFESIYSCLSGLLFSKEYRLVSELTADSVRVICELLELPTQFEFSGRLNYRSEEAQDGESKILRICEMLGAQNYINPKNGKELYDVQHFNNRNIALNFICMDDIVYRQFQGDKFVPNLSIIDVLMFNDIKQTKELLNKYTLN
jgi:hypothetical protein